MLSTHHKHLYINLLKSPIIYIMLSRIFANYSTMQFDMLNIYWIFDTAFLIRIFYSVFVITLKSTYFYLNKFLKSIVRSKNK